VKVSRDMKFQFLLMMTLGLAAFGVLNAQTGLPRELRKAYASSEEIVSFSQSTSFSDALETLNDLSKKFMNKIIVDPEEHGGAIGIDINRVHWLTALELILRNNDLWYEQHEDYIKIVTPSEGTDNLSAEERSALKQFEQRDVVISAVFFEADVSKLREAGMSWLYKRGKGVGLDIQNNSSGSLDVGTQSGNSGGNNQSGGGQGGGKLFQVKISPDLSFADITATFDALESDNIGNVISRPQVTVGSGEEGRIQVGSDIAITVQDFAGNSVTQFFSTGSIIKVKPEVIQYDSINFISMRLEIERSNSNQSADGGLEIKKSKANTSVMLLDGEETIIGGLYVTEDRSSRSGIPLLKDLPWWFFGLKYVFGFESKSMVKKELLILIRAELLPTLEDRFRAKVEGLEEKNLLQKLRESELRKMKHYRDQVEHKPETGTDR